MALEKLAEINRAYKIAVDDLRSNYGEYGIYAGPKNHHEYWARDSFFASYGAISLRDYEIVKKNLDLFTKYQKEDGHIPLRIEERFHGPAIIGINIPHGFLKAIFRPSQPWAGEVIDSNPLYLIALSVYILRSGDKEWAIRNKEKIMKAVSWLVGKFNDKGLVTEGYNAGWADFTFKRGNVFYTNVLVWKAFSLLCRALPSEESSYCLLLTKKLEDNLNKYFWSKRRGYYYDHIGIHGNMHKVFASDGNLLSIFFKYTSIEKGKKIMHFIDKNNLNRIPVPIYFKGLEWKHKFWNDLVYPGYNTENTFTWWGSISAVCRIKLGEKRGAIHDLYNLSKIIINYGTVPEIVDPRGRLVKRGIYKSELKSSWAAGMFVYAYNYASKKGVFHSI